MTEAELKAVQNILRNGICNNCLIIIRGEVFDGLGWLGKLSWQFLGRSAAAKTGMNTVVGSESTLGHIFRNAPGHVNPSTVTSQSRYINLFEKVANNSANLNPNVLTNFHRTTGGFQGFSHI